MRISGGDSVRRVTDLSSIKDKDTSNDELEDFTAYESVEWYRYTVYLLCSSKYTTPLGGKVYFADSVEAVEPELGCISNDSNAKYNLVTAFVYFTVSEEEKPTVLLGDVDSDGKVDIFDASSIQKSIAGMTGYPNYYTLDKNSLKFRVADVDGDGLYPAKIIQSGKRHQCRLRRTGGSRPAPT